MKLTGAIKKPQLIPIFQRKNSLPEKLTIFALFSDSLILLRLFEMGFQVQLHEILHRLPESRQTLLFSATLPKLLVDFSKAGLHDPTLVRLDVDTKLSENLKVCKTS